MGSLGSSSTAKVYPPGIHVPSLTWFKDGDEQAIDWEVQEKHIRFLVDSGLHGIVIAGTNGEAAALTREEKSELIRLTRSLAPSSLPITAGCNGGCTRAVIDDILAAHTAGADFALVLVPSYFHFAMTKDAIRDFFLEVADKSPLPVVVYNFPGVVSGLDVDSELLSVLGKHPNIVAVKLTCGGIAKVERVAAEFGSFWSKSKGEKFRALAGQSDWLVPALAAGGIGCITGLANLYPKACIKMFDLWVEGKLAEAMELQIELSKCEVGFGQGGINGTKWVVAHMLGYPESSSHCRRPYPQFVDEKKKEWVLSKMKLCSHLEK